MLHRLCRVEEIEDNTWKVFNVPENYELLVGQRHGRYFAVDNACPHKGAPLSKGDFEGDNIRCHRHFYEYNLFTGKLEKMPSWKRESTWHEQSPAWMASGDLKTYPVVVEDGYLNVMLP